MSRTADKRARWVRRKRRIRQSVRGTAERPRLTVYKSNRYTYVQVIDDDAGHTLVAASNREKELSTLGNDVSGASQLGESLGERLVGQKITALVFDRNGYPFAGKVQAIAEGVRKAGIRV